MLTHLIKVTKPKMIQLKNKFGIIKIFELKQILKFIFCMLILGNLIKVNPAYVMDTGKVALDVVNAIQNENIDRANELLHVLANENLTENQARTLHEIMTRALGNREVVEYGVNNFEIQNSGEPYQEPANIRNVITTIGIAIAMTATVYLIYRNWDIIYDTFFNATSRFITRAFRTILLENYQLIRNNPEIVRECLEVVRPERLP